MRAVMPSLLPEVAYLRKKNGSDRWDEMWEGELHMPPMPNRDHSDFVVQLLFCLRKLWARPGERRVHQEINVAAPGQWPNSYRIPDLVLLTADRFGIDKNEYFEGGPNVVVEIRSPGDESREKLPFYFSIGVAEVWLIDRDSREPEVHFATGPAAAADGWLVSPETGLQLQGGDGCLRVRLDAILEELRGGDL